MAFGTRHARALCGLLLGLVAASSAHAATGTRTSSFAYDGASGLLTQEVVEPNTPALRLEKDYSFDAYGNKTQVSVKAADIANPITSTVSYDGRGQFATTATNALGQSESWTTDPRFGLPLSHTGPNGLTTTWSYDSFGRKTHETRPDGTQTSWSYQYCSGTNGGTESWPDLFGHESAIDKWITCRFLSRYAHARPHARRA